MSGFFLGTFPRQPSPVAMVSFLMSPLSRGALRYAGVSTIAASTFPAPRPRLSYRGRGIWEDSCQARGSTPCAPRGGLCGCLAVRQTFSEAIGGTCRLAPPCVGWSLSDGPPLGALRRRFREVFAFRSRLPTAPWGIYEGGKQMQPAASPAEAGQAARLARA
jgi:hypothetical protein